MCSIKSITMDAPCLMCNHHMCRRSMIWTTNPSCYHILSWSLVTVVLVGNILTIARGQGTISLSSFAVQTHILRGHGAGGSQIGSKRGK